MLSEGHCWDLMHLPTASPGIDQKKKKNEETMGNLTASSCPVAGNLTIRWVMPGILAHIDRRQSAV